MITDLLQVVPSRLIQAVSNELLRACCHQLVNNLLPTCYVQTISDLLEQLVASLLASSTLLQDDTNLFQTCQHLGASSANSDPVDKRIELYTRKYRDPSFNRKMATHCF